MFNFTTLFRSIFLQKILKSTAIYASGNFINAALPFILIPILTRHLDPSDYGILATFMALYSVVEILIYMGTTDAVMRGYYDRDRGGFKFSEYIFNAFFINTVICCIIFLAWLGLKKYLIKIIPIPFDYQLLIPLAAFFVAVYTIPSKLWIIMKKPLQYTVFYSSNTSIELILSIFLVVFLGFNWK